MKKRKCLPQVQKALARIFWILHSSMQYCVILPSSLKYTKKSRALYSCNIASMVSHKNIRVRLWIIRLPTFYGFWRFLVSKELANCSFIHTFERRILQQKFYLAGVHTNNLFGEHHASNRCICAVLANPIDIRHHELVEVCSGWCPSLVCIECPFAK